MQLKTILNRIEPCKSFVYGDGKIVARGRKIALEVPVRPRGNGQPIGSGCHRRGPGYDRLPRRRFEYVPLWAIPVFFGYSMRRVDCVRCGVTVEEVPWGDGNCPLTRTYRWFLARWAKRLSWKEVAAVFGTSGDSVFRSVKYAVWWGRVHRQLSGVEAIGGDEVQWQRGHH